MDRRDWWRQHLQRLYSASNLLGNIDKLSQRINEKIIRDEPELIRGIIARRFATSGGSAGNTWTSLAASTIKQRAALGFSSGPILVRSGTLLDAAVKGKLKAYPTRITLTMLDRAAPRYVGKGRARKKKITRSVAQGNDFFGLSFGASGRLRDYAPRLNEERPFYGEPTREEITPFLQRRNQIISDLVGRIAAGESIWRSL